MKSKLLDLLTNSLAIVDVRQYKEHSQSVTHCIDVQVELYGEHELVTI